MASWSNPSTTVWPFRAGATAPPSAGASGAPHAVQEVSVREAYARSRKGARLVDVRTPMEFRGSHPPGARNVPPSRIKKDETGLARDDELLVICLSGHRSPRAARRLAKLGFSDVSHVEGGLLAWKKAGLPLTK
jgi:rhodanese-related sulfurtransferase